MTNQTPKTKLIPEQVIKYVVRDYTELAWSIVIGGLVGAATCAAVGYGLNKSIPSAPILAITAVAGAITNRKRCYRRWSKKQIIDTYIEVPIDYDPQIIKGKRKVRKPIF